MDRLLYLLPLLACPVAMGVMMWLMMRGHRSESPPSSAPLDADERAELVRLRVAAGRAPHDQHAAGSEDRARS